MSGKPMRFGAAGLALAAAMTAPAATSAMEGGTDRERRACTPDVFRLCGEFIPDAGRITTCLQRNVNLLSPECRAVFARPSRRTGGGDGRI
jgi:hypothetical protein